MLTTVLKAPTFLSSSLGNRCSSLAADLFINTKPPHGKSNSAEHIPWRRAQHVALPAGKGPLARGSFHTEHNLLIANCSSAGRLNVPWCSQGSPDVNESLTKRLCCSWVPVLNKKPHFASPGAVQEEDGFVPLYHISALIVPDSLCHSKCPGSQHTVPTLEVGRKVRKCFRKQYVNTSPLAISTASDKLFF